MLTIFVDADACPVKQEVCKVAGRYGLEVTFVSNTPMRIPEQGITKLVVVDGGNLDAADDYIAEHVTENDVVVTADIPLASRCVKNGAKVITPTGRIYDAGNVGDALAARNLMSELREAGTVTGGPPPFQKKDRSQFLQSLDKIIQSIKRG